MTNPVMGSAKRAACALVTYIYDQTHARQARRVLSSLERAAGRLQPHVKRQCEDYAHEVLGSKAYAPWLYVYSAMAGEFKVGWISDNYYGHVVVPRLQGAYGAISNRKALASRLFTSDVFPDLVFRVNGVNYGTTGERIRDAELATHLFREGDAVVFKGEGSSQGRSVFVLRADEFRGYPLGGLGNGVFQTYVRQHPFFSEYTSSSVATIRLTSVIDDSGTPSVRACYARFARQGDSHVISASQVRVAVDPRSGRLHDRGYFPSWTPTDMHPDSHVRFSGATIPLFAECVATVVELHRRLPFARAIGWDAIVDDRDRVRILEWNGEHNGIRFSEATQGPCFADLGWEHLWKTRASVSREWVTAMRQGLC
jgi:hypothetical protein